MKPVVVSFSGLDGAGKSTQANLLAEALRLRGWRVATLTMYGDVSTAARMRSILRTRRRPHSVAARPVATCAPSGQHPEAGGQRQAWRRDKNRRDMPTVLLRHCAYALDLVHFARIRRHHRAARTDVLVMDRYFYDLMANLLAARSFTQAYARAFMHLVPAPQVPVLLRISPRTSLQRVCEYPPDYLAKRGRAYEALFQGLGHELVLDGERGAEHVHQAVLERVDNCLDRCRGHRHVGS